jgi:large subunit ribosomal protein L13
MMKTFLPKDPGADRGWVLVDVAGKPLGRAAVRIANLLRGKNKVIFTPQVDTGDFVVVVNAARVRLTGRKETQKFYRRYSGYRGGLKLTPAAVVRERHPDWLVRWAVRGMLPRNNMGRQMFRRLKVYAGDQHPHAAQKPEPVHV